MACLSYITARSRLSHARGKPDEHDRVQRRGRWNHPGPSFHEEGSKAWETDAGTASIGPLLPPSLTRRQEASLFLNATSPRLSATPIAKHVRASSPGKRDVAYDHWGGASALAPCLVGRLRNSSCSPNLSFSSTREESPRLAHLHAVKAVPNSSP
jgi:hypothetical protein